MDRLNNLIGSALERRRTLLNDPQHRQALRLFNGFTEGCKALSVDLMGRTAVIQDYSDDGGDFAPVAENLCRELDFLQAVLLKRRRGQTPAERNGTLIYGEKCDTFVVEHNVRYACDLQMNHDNGFYSDTRFLRKYLLENMRGKRVLNTFAYTGSLGSAAAMGGAEYVLQSDVSNNFLQTAYRTASLNGFAFTRKNFRIGDFFAVTAALRKEKTQFDCVILDPPFYSASGKGVIDLANNPLGVINKVRPLVADNGLLIVVNNSLYLSGRDFMAKLSTLCNDGFMEIESVIPIPEDFACNSGETMPYPADPAPFNHPTKIVAIRAHCR